MALDPLKIIQKFSPQYQSPSPKLSSLKKLLNRILRWFFCVLVFTPSISAQSAADSARVLWLGDAIELVNRVTAPQLNVIAKERAVTIKINNLRKKTRMIRRLDRLKRTGRLSEELHTTLMSELLDINVAKRLQYGNNSKS